MKPFKNSKIKSLKNTHKLLSSVLTLPIHPFLKENDLKYVAKEIKDFTI
jgi:dTDP-4-amino-4,6-dideoxygalactose transaminase